MSDLCYLRKPRICIDGQVHDDDFCTMSDYMMISDILLLHFIKEKRKKYIKEVNYSSRVMKSLKANKAKIITTLASLFHPVIHFR